MPASNNTADTVFNARASALLGIAKSAVVKHGLHANLLRDAMCEVTAHSITWNDPCTIDDDVDLLSIVIDRRLGVPMVLISVDAFSLDRSDLGMLDTVEYSFPEVDLDITLKMLDHIFASIAAHLAPLVQAGGR